MQQPRDGAEFHETCDFPSGEKRLHLLTEIGIDASRCPNAVEELAKGEGDNSRLTWQLVGRFADSKVQGNVFPPAYTFAEREAFRTAVRSMLD